MNCRMLVVSYVKVLCICVLAVSLSHAEPFSFKDSPFLLELKDGTVLTITSIVTHNDRDGRQMFIYKTVSGKEGYKWQDQIANVDQLMNTISPRNRALFPEPVQESTDADSSKDSIDTESISTATAEVAANVDMIERCEQQWGAEDGMAEDCIAQQLDAALWIQDNYLTRSDLSKAEYRIVNGCANKWKDQIKGKNNFDYAKIKVCIEEQMGAYQRGQ